jgi:predicted DCC family thiol-disulfide oxidoreductase YuxK
LKRTDASNAGSAQAAKQNAIILFDGVCNLCNASIRFVLARDQRDYFRFAPFQSAAGRSLAAKHNLTTDLSTFFLIERGKVYQRSSAWLEIMRLLGKPWSALYFFRIMPQSIRDWIYDLIGRHRYRLFGRQNSCPVPKRELRWKFLS